MEIKKNVGLRKGRPNPRSWKGMWALEESKGPTKRALQDKKKKKVQEKIGWEEKAPRKVQMTLD